MAIGNKVLFSLSNMMRTFEVLLISIFLSRFIQNKNQLGELLQVIFVSSVMITIISGFPLAMNFFYGKYADDSRKDSLFGKFLFSICAISFCLCLLIFIFRTRLGESFQNVIFENHIFIILMFLFVKSLNTIFPNYHYLRNKLGKYLLLYTLTTTVLIVLFCYDYYVLGFSNSIILLQLFVVEMLRLLINIFIVNRREMRYKGFFFDRTEFIYIGSISLGVLLGAFNLYVDKYLIAVLLDPTQFVFYQNGAINLPFVNIITSSLFIASIPIFAELYSKGKFLELIHETKLTILKCSLFLLPILVYCFFEAVPLIKILYGDDFEASGEVFQIYILRYILSVMAFSVFMGSIGLEKKSNLIILVSSIIGLVLNSILIPIYGINGASWAIVIASLSTIFISLYLIGKQLITNIYDFFPVKNYLGIIFISIIFYIPFYFLNNNISYNWIVLLSSLIYYFIVLWILNYHFKIVDFRRILNKK